ncbi:MAG: helix-turn-helix domain-containing protein [Gemmataceae bacterium]
MERSTSQTWIELPETRAARRATARVLRCLMKRGPRRTINPLFLHGPAGVGKSRLVADLITGLTRRVPDAVVTTLAAGDLDGRDDVGNPKQADLVVVEDAHKARGAEAFTALVDHCVSRHRQLVVTATCGPGQLSLPGRLTSRLAQGLVVAIEALSPDSRRAFLRAKADLNDDVLDFVVRHTAGSVRQLEGALARVTALGRSPSLEEVREVFRDDAEARRPTLDRIAHRVGRFYQVDLDELRSQRRSREVLLPRQVGMYLARRLTPLSLGQIGAYFGGRDHSTVLHACKKVEEALARDASLSGALRELHADLA